MTLFFPALRVFMGVPKSRVAHRGWDLRVYKNRARCRQLVLSERTDAERARLQGLGQETKQITMFRKCLIHISLRRNRQRYRGVQRAAGNYGDVRRRDASSATVMGENVKLKSMEDLGGPSFMTTLNWLFVKGYFKTTQQLQVRGWRSELNVTQWPTVNSEFVPDSQSRYWLWVWVYKKITQVTSCFILTPETG